MKARLGVFERFDGELYGVKCKLWRVTAFEANSDDPLAGTAVAIRFENALAGAVTELKILRNRKLGVTATPRATLEPCDAARLLGMLDEADATARYKLEARVAELEKQNDALLKGAKSDFDCLRAALAATEEER